MISWELIGDYEYRAKVPGGWIVKVLADVVQDRSDYGRGLVAGWDWRIGICFVPDPLHAWTKDEGVNHTSPPSAPTGINTY